MRALHCPGIKGVHLSPTLQQDKGVVLNLLNRVQLADLDQPRRTLHDKGVVLKAFHCPRINDFHLSATLQDKEVAMMVLIQGLAKFGDLGEALRGDKVFAMEALSWGVLEDFHQLSKVLQEDKEVVMVSLGHVAMDIRDICEALRGDKEVVMKALGCVRLHLHQLSPTL
eukprot:TRINITY_DN23152_c0_g1_i1.p1 TRINITY_DN23152_c0_g1~~TRINITY_DN23152_c0_g1_i1.p1  ORF type:complete len:169 (+),score=7.20 TRINITY_DN23152_c0_g1_i1:368-874(+)